MNNIADFIPALILCSAGLGIIAAASLMWFEHVAARLSGANQRPLVRQAPAPRPTLVVLHQGQAQAPSANAASIQAAA